MRIFRNIGCFSALFCVSMSSYAQKEEIKIKYLGLSDIHFSPFDTCEKDLEKCKKLLSDLEQADAKDWDNIFSKYYQNIQNPMSKEDDSNYPLFLSLMNQLKKDTTDNKYSFAILLGDLLGHDYVENIEKYITKDEQRRISFIKKTFQFISLNFRNAINKNTDIIPAIGNNDSYYEDYHLDDPEKSTFYKDLSLMWRPFSSQINWKDFEKLGYYSVNIKDENLKIISLNTNIFSRKAKNKQGSDINKFIDMQLKWFDNELKNSGDKKVLIISHIPLGIDAYSAAKAIKNNKDPVPYWSNNEELILKPFLNSYSKYANKVVAMMVGHTHFDTIQLIDKKKEMFSVTVPSLSQDHQNNSGYKTLSLNKNYVLTNFDTVYFNSKTAQWQLRPQSFSTEYAKENVFQGIDFLISKWAKDPKTADKIFIDRYMLGKENEKMEKDWVYYMCSFDSNLTIEAYKNCIEKNK